MTERNRELEEALEQIDLESWLDAEGFRYKRTRGTHGVQLNVKTCPCCGKDSWKVYLNAETGLGNCFSCEEKFNKWKFIKNGIGAATARDAVDHIKKFAMEQGWRPLRREAVEVKETKLKIPESYALPISGRNLKYLENRGINGDYAKYFGLRFCQRGKFWYSDADGRNRFQDYSMRIIIPVFDLDGTMVSFQGRDITGASDKRYLFPPGFASTGAHLYNGHNALGASHVVVGEGVFDVAAIRIALDGAPELREVGAIGSFGKHLSDGDEESQLAKLVSLKDKGLRIVTFMWDGEGKAIEAAVDAAMKVKGVGLTARIAMLPKDKDPNEVPAEVVRQAFWKAETVTSLASAAKLKALAHIAYRDK
jgi:DNA primase